MKRTVSSEDVDIDEGINRSTEKSEEDTPVNTDGNEAVNTNLQRTDTIANFERMKKAIDEGG